MLTALFDVLMPDGCPGCGAGSTGPLTRVLCAACEGELPGLPVAVPAPGPLAGAWVGGPHAGPLGDLVRRSKYRPDPWLVGRLGAHLARLGVGRLPTVDAVTHVPVPWPRRMKRGFDQGHVLARAVADELGRPHLTLLRRIPGPEQAGRRRAARLASARRSFRAAGGAGAPGRILLVDDVLTTGATAAACADVLIGSGARRVYLLTLSAARLPSGLLGHAA